VKSPPDLSAVTGAASASHSPAPMAIARHILADIMIGPTCFAILRPIYRRHPRDDAPPRIAADP
jgi:hypothetical protein